MASIMQVGYVAKPGEDVLPTTGPHLDVRVLKDGQYINPETWRSGLQRLKIGKARTPLYKQDGGNWMTPYQITSGFGPRKAPTAGASTDHKGIDYGVAGGEQLFWEGPGTFKPGSGYGSIMTPEGYEVRLLHTKGGKAAATGQQGQPTAPAPTAQQQTPGGGPVTYNIYMRQQKEKQPTSQDFLSSFLSQQLMQQPEQSNLLSQNEIFKALTAATAV